MGSTADSLRAMAKFVKESLPATAKFTAKCVAKYPIPTAICGIVGAEYSTARQFDYYSSEEIEEIIGAGVLGSSIIGFPWELFLNYLFSPHKTGRGIVEAFIDPFIPMLGAMLGKEILEEFIQTPANKILGAMIFGTEWMCVGAGVGAVGWLIYSCACKNVKTACPEETPVETADETPLSTIRIAPR